VFFEDFDLPAQVVLMDSFNTTNQGFLVVGEEEDDFFGKTSATGYSRLYIDSRVKRPDSKAILDSVRFNLKVANVDGTDLDQVKTLSVHKLQEPIQDTLYYNFDALNFDLQPFSQGEFVMGEKNDSTLSFAVDTVFANEIFSKMQLGREFNDLFSFREYFPGIAVKGKIGDNTAYSIAAGSNTGMTIFYHNEGDTVSTKYLMNTISSRSFNGIKSDRSGSATSSVQLPNVAYDLNSQVGMKANLGLVIKVDTSPFDAFLDTLSGIHFNQVSLEIGELEAFPANRAPPSPLSIYFTDDRNMFLQNSSNFHYSVQESKEPQVIIDQNGETMPSVSTPLSVNFNSVSKLFSAEITSHLNAIFRGQLARKDWILYGGFIPNKEVVSGDRFRQSMRQFVVDKNRIKVKVVYSKTR
jgi:hypothetical protein